MSAGARPSLLHHITARRRPEGRKILAAKSFRSIDLWATTLGEPAHVVRPPGARGLLRRFQPLLRVIPVDRPSPERRLRVAGRVHQRRDMTAGGKHVAVVLAAEQARAAIGG